MTKTTKPRACSICHLLYSTSWGHDAWPLREGRCCDDCHVRFVIPARLLMMSEKCDAQDDPPSPEIWAAVQILTNPITDASVSSALAEAALARGPDGESALWAVIRTVRLGLNLMSARDLRDEEDLP